MRIYLPPEEIAKGGEINLPPDKSHYLLSVLRVKKGQDVTVINGAGMVFGAVVTGTSKHAVTIAIAGEGKDGRGAETDLRIVLCQGILKGEKMDVVLQKTTELGISEFSPVITERCLVRETRKVGRWRKIAEEAVEQCGGAVIPRIHEPRLFGTVVRQGGPVLKGLIFRPESGRDFPGAFDGLLPGPPDAEPAGDGIGRTAPGLVHLLVGPEGGFTEREVLRAEECGLVATSLGRRVLRAETAAIVAVALMNAFWGDRRKRR